MECRICGNDKDNKDYYVKDYEFGGKNTFKYFQCPVCKCLQIAEIPADMSIYYNSDYYSFKDPNEGIVNKIRLLRDGLILRGGGGGIVRKLLPGQDISFLFDNNFLSKDDKILDIGCGAGAMLYSLKENGFDKVLGLDPFLDDTIHYSNGLTLLKTPITELKDSDFDLIMLNNSFEHMDDPAGVLNSAGRLLASDGTIIINIPTVSSLAWEIYKEKWIILGAPQHFYLHSIESMRYLAEKCGLDLKRAIYSSSVHHSVLLQEQFINRNILPFGKRSYKTSLLNYILNIPRVIKCQKIAEELNAKNQGERCLFVLKKR